MSTAAPSSVLTLTGLACGALFAGSISQDTVGGCVLGPPCSTTTVPVPVEPSPAMSVSGNWKPGSPFCALQDSCKQALPTRVIDRLGGRSGCIGPVPVAPVMTASFTKIGAGPPPASPNSRMCSRTVVSWNNSATIGPRLHHGLGERIRREHGEERSRASEELKPFAPQTPLRCGIQRIVNPDHSHPNLSLEHYPTLVD